MLGQLFEVIVFEHECGLMHDGRLQPVVALSQHLVVQLLKLFNGRLARVHKPANRLKLLEVLLAALLKRLQFSDLERLFFHHVFKVAHLDAQVLAFL